MIMQQFKLDITKMLADQGIESASFESTQILKTVFESEEFRSFDHKSIEMVMQMVKRRISGEPLQYILGEWEFYSLPFYCGEGVLIPRPETELLVDVVLDYIKNAQLLDSETMEVADLCSGSGCIAVAIDKNVNSSVNITAWEKSAEAFSYLSRNIVRNNSQVKALLADIFKYDTQDKFNVIVSNPPYIPTDEINGLQSEVRCFEPLSALDGGVDGLVFYRGLTEKWVCRLKQGGIMAVEIGVGEEDEVKKLFAAAGLTNILEIPDLQGIGRVIVGTMSI